MGFKPYSLIKNWLLQRNLRIKDYNTLNNEDKEFVDLTIKNDLKANPILRVGRKKKHPKKYDFWQLSWNDIILLRMYLSQKDINSIHKLLYKIEDNQFLSLNLFNSTAVYKWVAEQIKNISDIEKQELGEPDSEDIEAGIDKLQEFDYAVTLDILSKGNLLEEDKLLQQPYSIIFRKLCLNKAKAEIQKAYMENARRKNKANRQ